VERRSGVLMSDLELAVVRVLADAATTFAMELATPDLVGLADADRLRRAPAVAELASLAGHRPDLLLRARRSVAALAETDDLLATAALWAAFTGD
jgi:hypothetical protein